jgi:hypothetical protein
MNIVQDSLLIASAPADILVGLGILFALAALTLLALAVEAGVYPAVCDWLKAVQPRGILMRRHRRWALLYH